jgi:hypothetical protein
VPGQRRTTSYDGYQNRLATRPELIAAGGASVPSLHGPRRADKFTDALSSDPSKEVVVRPLTDESGRAARCGRVEPVDRIPSRV